MHIIQPQKLRWDTDEILRVLVPAPELGGGPIVSIFRGERTECGRWGIHQEKHGRFILTHQPTGRMLKASKSKRALRQLAQRLTDTRTDWTQTDESYYQRSEVVVGLRDFLRREHVVLDGSRPR